MSINPLDITHQIDEFKQLETGWLDGKGEAPSHEGLDWLASEFDQRYPDDMPLPRIYPTPEGGVQAEWAFGPWRMSLEVDLLHKNAEGHTINLQTCEGDLKVVELDLADGWEYVMNGIRNLSGVIV